MARRVQSELQYDSRTRVYHFVGERLPLPAPGTYDPTAWTPPTRRRYDVHMQGDGLWWLVLNGARVQSGDSLVPNRANARKIIVAWRARNGQS